MPKAFRDMILIAQKLKIRYVWIDALCIIQANASDLEEESSWIADVYTNSYLTVSTSTLTTI